MKSLLQRFYRLIGLVGLLFLCSWGMAAPALAVTPIRLFDLSYRACPADVGEGVMTSGGIAMPANCFLITGKAENKSGKSVIDADIFGRIYDANGNPVLQNRTRLGAIPEVLPGISNFELRVSVPSDQPTPLKLEQFKASGFSGKVRPYST